MLLRPRIPLLPRLLLAAVGAGALVVVPLGLPATARPRLGIAIARDWLLDRGSAAPLRAMLQDGGLAPLRATVATSPTLPEAERAQAVRDLEQAAAAWVGQRAAAGEPVHAAPTALPLVLEVMVGEQGVRADLVGPSGSRRLEQQFRRRARLMPFAGGALLALVLAWRLPLQVLALGVFAAALMLLRTAV